MLIFFHLNSHLINTFFGSPATGDGPAVVRRRSGGGPEVVRRRSGSGGPAAGGGTPVAYGGLMVREGSLDIDLILI